MHKAVRLVIAAKAEMDRALREPGLRPLLPLEIANAAYSAFCAPSFMHALLPHLDTGNTLGRRRARIPLDCLIGESWKWRSPDPRRRSADELAAYLLDDARSADGDTDQAWVFQIQPFDLYVACEGKNRVQFLRDHGEQDMPARVTKIAYPDAERLALYTLGVAGRDECWCVLDGRQASRVLMPHLTTPLLGLLGVKLQRWPDSLLPGSAFIQALQERPHQHDATRPIDIAPLRAWLARETDAAGAGDLSLIELILQGQARPRWKPLRAAAIAFVAGCAGGLMLPAPWNDQAAMFMVGLLSGVTAACALPWLKARRRSQP
ncbi:MULTISPECIES: hypothetical protein [unclassified Brenneria]|uniref:hypothetical protein n=1 Tax=unclassified Brenneria TaxID=2634434 RepID=UPI0018F088FB|nr:hypothetical protein [Brenneria sp. L3-3C-1]MBJ7223503.1 hypothetical protein [Brenneria sp. L3-3C-1]MEE3644744.1 hypothetical protein [Brenneria sp. L3_3C_1]